MEKKCTEVVVLPIWSYCFFAILVDITFVVAWAFFCIQMVLVNEFIAEKRSMLFMRT